MDKLITDEREVSAERLRSRAHAKVMKLDEILPMLVSPEMLRPLVCSQDKTELADGSITYPIIEGIPVLYPEIISKAFLGPGLELKYYDNSKLQYFMLSQIKQRGEINADSSNTHYQRHLYRMKSFLEGCQGRVLDVGCDNVEISAALFGEDCRYVGLDPFAGTDSGFRVVGVGEFLPFADRSVDNVVFNTSLDHILDYHQAIDEASRVLVPGGSLYLITLAWTERATLLSDLVHFHHFREYEIFGSLRGFEIIRTLRYRYKEDDHRYGLFVHASKSSN